MNRPMILFYASISLAIVSSVLYHLSQKLTPAGVNPALALIVTYTLSLLMCLLLLPFFPLPGGVLAGLRQVNWASVALAFSLVGLEVGYLLAYRAGWNISVAAVLSNVTAGVVLLLLGLAFFRERLSAVNLLGIGLCLAGLILMNWKR